MILIFTLTMLFNRNKAALHTLCLIAIIILLLDPMAIFTVSFQLSFSAVFAMLVYNLVRQNELIIDYSYTARFFRNIMNTVNISIIAFTATMFTVAVHFGYISIYSILANVIASFLMALVVMPALFLFFIGYIVLDISIFANLNNYALNMLTSVANYFSSFENSSIYISSDYSWVLFAVTAVVLIAIIFNFERKYLITVALYTLAFIIPIKIDLRPSVIEFGGNAIGLREDNQLMILGELEPRQINKVLKYYNLELANNDKLKTSCDLTGCLYDFNDKKILQVNEGFDINFEETNMVDYVLYKH